MSDSLQHLEELIGQGRYMEARLLCEKEKEPSLRHSQLYALALSKSGSPKQALNYLEPVFIKHPDDPETSGILGGIFKELFRVTQDSSYAVRSRDTYLQNFSATKNYYTGINAATMSAIAGQMRNGREIAAEVINVIDEKTTEFWELCTLAEAYLLLKNKQQSVDLYFKARAIAHSDWGKINSVYNQLWLINHYTGVPKDVMKAFSPPAVAAFVGHMIDSSTREKPRFPAAIEQQIKGALKSAVQTNNIRIGYCALACGGDILFAEAIEAVGGEVNISLPFNPADFIELSVRFAGEDWVNRFTRLIEKYPVRLITEEGYGGYNDLFSFESKIIFGSAVLRSEAQHAEPKLVTVLSEADLRRMEGGTRDTLRLWPFPKQHTNINPDVFITGSEPRTPEGPTPVYEKINDRPVLYLVAIDFSGSNVMEKDRVKEELNDKIEGELSVCKAMMEENEVLLLAFESESGAVDVLMDLHEIRKNKLVRSNLKIALHAGPVYIKGENLEGENVEMMYDLCKMAPEGVICASDYIAAILTLDQKRFSIDYAGVLSSRKGNRSVYAVTLKSIQSKT